VFAALSILEVFRRECARIRYRETGGVLFGYRTDEDDIVVTDATGPGPRARHSWRFFEPDTRYCQEQLSRIYRETQGAVSYLGEWHTHPYGSTLPSRRDSATMSQIAVNARFRQPEPLLWIYRPPGRILMCNRPGAPGIWVFDASAMERRAVLHWLNAIPGS
jgi:integrative and conjugative element protein (TIGR02256 family)